MPITVLDPTVAPTVREFHRAARLATLEGTTLALLNNSKANADVFLDELAGVLRARYGVNEVIFAGKPSSSKIASRALLDDLAVRAHGIITGIGD
jgi:hypothetical protein